MSNIPVLSTTVNAFDVEYVASEPEPGYGAVSDPCNYDYLLIDGARYCGTTGPAGVVVLNGSITWRSDFIETRSGWELCWEDDPP